MTEPLQSGPDEERQHARSLPARWFGPPAPGTTSYLWPRWIVLRALGLIFFSAFFSFAFQIQGLIGPRGILPAGDYLRAVAQAYPSIERFWLAPTLLWIASGHGALTALVAAGIVCSVALTLNLWPRLACALCTLFYLSCIGALQVFSSYQSDGMLLAAGFIAIFFSPPGLWPGLGAARPPSPAALFLLRWEWFRIYFESGIAKLASGDPSWRNLTAMDHYYQNGPLPTWIGWYVQQLPHPFHAFVTLLTLAVELGIVWLAWLPRRFRLACFFIVTPFQIAIILTANYAFLNYLVLVLGLLLLDDRALAHLRLPLPSSEHRRAAPWRLWGVAAVFTWIFYGTVVSEVALFTPLPTLLTLPDRVIAPFRIANDYALFATMTPARYEIEFQGTRDGVAWTAYPFRYKPQDPSAPPGIYAPYQPRFDWNLWFASLDSWRNDPWVVRTQIRLLENSPSVLALFRGNPFGDAPPSAVRAVLWQYSFTDLATRRRTGRWWNRTLLGLYAPVAVRDSTGAIQLQAGP
ncbi:MAG TPA: lipase maturation factor family protein [Gemmatimonadaceae bacterium]|nr:lipase maturation factor family protein [Gemmatimonadaceae bacterium]